MLNKKIYFLFLISFGYISCSLSCNSEEKFNLQKQEMTFSLEIVTQEIYEAVKNKHIDKLLRDSIAKEDGILKLPLIPNSHKIFRDVNKGDEDENIREYNYIGQFKEIKFYVISAVYWEHSEIFLVDKNNGELYSLWSYPFLSPDNKKIASILSYGLEGEPVGMQILSIKDNYFRIDKYIEFDQRLWNPLEMFWESDNSIILKVENFPNLTNETESSISYNYLRLNL